MKKSHLKTIIKELVREVVAEKCGKTAETVTDRLGEAGLTSETDEVSPTPDHAYDEKEELMLIKVMQLVASKLAAMHTTSAPVDGIEISTGDGGLPPENPSFPSMDGADVEQNSDDEGEEFSVADAEDSESPTEFGTDTDVDAEDDDDDDKP